MDYSIEKRLEEYSIAHPEEVLLINIETEGEVDQIAIFKGFSSSLMRPTSPDPDLPVFSSTAKIISIDRVCSPYNPENPIYIQQELTWKIMESLLLEMGI